LLISACTSVGPQKPFSEGRSGMCMSEDSICAKYPYCPGGTIKRDCAHAHWQMTCPKASPSAVSCGWLPAEDTSGWKEYPPGCVLSVEGQGDCVCDAEGNWMCSTDPRSR
jgi:hypothetical protein